MVKTAIRIWPRRTRRRRSASTPTNPAAYLNEGLASIELGDVDGAIEAFSAAIRLRPDYAVVYRSRGKAYERKGELQAGPGRPPASRAALARRQERAANSRLGRGAPRHEPSRQYRGAGHARHRPGPDGARARPRVPGRTGSAGAKRQRAAAGHPSGTAGRARPAEDPGAGTGGRSGAARSRERSRSGAARAAGPRQARAPGDVAGRQAQPRDRSRASAGGRPDARRQAQRGGRGAARRPAPPARLPVRCRNSRRAGRRLTTTMLGPERRSRPRRASVRQRAARRPCRLRTAWRLAQPASRRRLPDQVPRRQCGRNPWPRVKTRQRSSNRRSPRHRCRPATARGSRS